VYGTWTVQYLASVSIKHLHICKYCTFSKSTIFIYIRTQAFAVHTKYYVIQLVIFINNKRVGSSNYLIVWSARKASLPYMAQTCPQLPYMAQTCPQNQFIKVVMSLWGQRNNLFQKSPTLIFCVNRKSLGSNVNKYGGFWK
jgi:hypothetical protein